MASRPIHILLVAAHPADSFDMAGGTLAHDEESLELRTFSEAEVPWDELAFLSTREALRDYYAGVLHRHCR